jgi:hypothetical protein
MSCKTVERSAQTRDVPRATVADARIPRVAVQHSSGGEYSADSVGIAPADERIPCKIGRKVSTDEKDSTYDRRGNECCHQTVRRSFASECSADAVGFDRSGRMKKCSVHSQGRSTIRARGRSCDRRHRSLPARERYAGSRQPPLARVLALRLQLWSRRLQGASVRDVMAFRPIWFLLKSLPPVIATDVTAFC